MSYLDNDDDLFDYDPDEDLNSSLQSTEPSNQKSPDDFMSSAKSILDELAESSSDVIEQSKIKLASSFHLATSAFYAKVEAPTYEKAIAVVLDKITNGDFSLIHIFYRTEALIIQRLHFIDLMDRVVDPNAISNDLENDFTLKHLFDILKVECSVEHIKMFYAPSIAISRFCLNVDRILYQHLSNKLNIPVNPNLINPDYQVNSSELNDPVTNDYSDKAYPLIIKSIAAEGLLEKLQETFNVQVRLSNEME